MAVRLPTNTRMPRALLPASLSVSTSPLRTVTEKSVPSPISDVGGVGPRGPDLLEQVGGQVAVVHPPILLHNRG